MDGIEPAVTSAVTLTGVHKRFGRGKNATHALRGVNAAIAKGSFTAVMGPSGSGKSSLLQCAAGLDRPSSGSVRLGDLELSRMMERRLTTIRRERIGFVFQAYNILTALTVEQNVLMPLRLAGAELDRERAVEVLTLVGMERHIKARAGQLSGGEQQRVAIARSLVNNPEVVFADEPTGALDPAAAADVLALLRSLVDERSVTVVMVTHEPGAAAWADRVVILASGEIAHDTSDTDPQRIRERIFEASRRTVPVPVPPSKTHQGSWA
ncbi:ABC transporter ATP-binding protein [Streptomyces winkii]|uniref:ABC transporter ATP-binding protein n=1 Tax=Streptomyces winkii TaxID=3051178 RepID=UPI0028D01999|nr:ABC transporter ATP-binding protein [Streptomyces sp. DSM 40971]